MARDAKCPSCGNWAEIVQENKGLTGLKWVWRAGRQRRTYGNEMKEKTCGCWLQETKTPTQLTTYHKIVDSITGEEFEPEEENKSGA